ncbi:hypothetical protein N752_24045 [Desulforamulus aquiferis]|nr:phosphoenolpyruvate carboxykinase (ATP) [Desulforamulus aquiferis]RYD02407.1 hypothetical protein N752_24045 [Desulforamulus aquiferis]
MEAANIINNPSPEELRRMAAHKEKTTKFGSASFISQMRNRSAKVTFVVDADGFNLGVDQQGMAPEKALALAEQVHQFLQDKEVIQMDRQLCTHTSFKYHCRLYITKDFASIPLQWTSMTFEPEDKNAEPDLVSIYVPEWPEKIIFCHPVEKISYILGPDYFGECKKSFCAKQCLILNKEAV